MVRARFLPVRVKVTEEQGEKARMVHLVIKLETSVWTNFYLNIDIDIYTEICIDRLVYRYFLSWRA